MFAIRRALVDGNGFVGSHLRSQMHFDVHVDRRDVVRLLDESFDVVVCATVAPGGNWDGAADLDHLTAVARTLAHVRTRHLVVLSGVDVYGGLDQVDETAALGAADASLRGVRRAWFERSLREHHPSQLVVRLPELVGSRLGAGVLADLVGEDRVPDLDPRALHQFYDLSRLAADLQTSLDANLTTVNLVSEPVTLHEIIDAFATRPPVIRVRHAAAPSAADVRTCHAEVFGAEGRYLLSRDTVLDAIGRWSMSMAGSSFEDRRVS